MLVGVITGKSRFQFGFQRFQFGLTAVHDVLHYQRYKWQTIEYAGTVFDTCQNGIMYLKLDYRPRSFHLPDVPAPTTGAPMGLPVPISQIMHSGLLLECSPETTIAAAAARMAENSVSSILIRQHGTVVGIWTERDALAINFADPDPFTKPVSSVMSAPVLSLPATIDTAQAAIQLKNQNRHPALVTDETGKIVGILSRPDLALDQGLEPYLPLREVRAAISLSPVLVPGKQSLAEVAARSEERRVGKDWTRRRSPDA